MPNQILDYVMGYFESNLGVEGLTGRVAALPNGEAWVTIYAANPTPAMYDLARMIEAEFDELEKPVAICVQPSGGWLSRFKRRLIDRAVSAAV
ncbi:hypothetical protein [uncultured Thiodictyon sp.]|uniref:hypothetical protein n=1 Tax=uncultured Thiodictyon sp. TaxID=1846217 RepID=UPI0025FF7F59|nr:hypothetical protein [uncultured Thiodictyon sp.]